MTLLELATRHVDRLGLLAHVRESVIRQLVFVIEREDPPTWPYRQYVELALERAKEDPRLDSNINKKALLEGE